MRKKIIKIKRFIVIIVVIKVSLIVGLFFLFAIYTNVPTDYDAQDKVVFENKLQLRPFRNPKTFEEEIIAIKTIQRRTFLIAPVGTGIPDYESREPVDFIGRQEGLCFDRSRTTDKALSYIGLPSRHVYLLFQQKGQGFWHSMFRYRAPSHAITEVKTKRGWMFIDSNTDWIGITRDGQVVNADDVWKRAADFENIPSYLKRPWWAIRGMYSRKGQLYPPYIFFPDINWPDFFSWFFFG